MERDIYFFVKMTNLTDEEVSDENKDNNMEEAIIVETCNGFVEFVSKLKKKGINNLKKPTLEKLIEMKSAVNEIKISNADVEASTGARSKHTKRESSSDISSDQTDSSDVDTSLKEDTEEENKSKHNSNNNSETRKKKKTKKGKRVSITKLMKSFDNRQMPKFPAFNEESGQDLDQYLKKFEAYCTDNLRGNTSYWIGELETYLPGETLKTFETLRNFDDDYDTVKEKLLSWFKTFKRDRREIAKNKFTNARRKPGETFYMFSIRMENLFKLAYPDKDTEYNAKLINHYTSVLPGTIRELLRSKIMDVKLSKNKVSWKFVQKCVKIRDSENIKTKTQHEEIYNKQERVEQEDEGIVINLGEVASKHKETNNDEVFVNSAEHNENRRKPEGRREHASRTYVGQKRRESNNTDRRTSNNFKCYACNKTGHVARDCNSSVRQCYICNSADHLMRDCPRNYNNYRGANRHERRNHHSSSSGDYRNSTYYRRSGGDQHNRRNSRGYYGGDRYNYQNGGQYSRQNDQQRTETRQQNYPQEVGRQQQYDPQQQDSQNQQSQHHYPYYQRPQYQYPQQQQHHQHQQQQPNAQQQDARVEDRSAGDTPRAAGTLNP